MDLLDVLKDFEPTRMANGQIRCMCPFRENHTDGSGRMSFFLNPEIGAYHCFAGETRVPTSEGTFSIKDLSGRTVKVLTSNGTFVDASFKEYGKQLLWEIHLTKDGLSKIIRATSGHRWFVKGVKSTLTTSELKVGHYLQSVDFAHVQETEQSYAGIRHGIVFGDGTTDRSRKRIKTLVNLHGHKMELASYFSATENRGVKVRGTGERYIRIYDVRGGGSFKELPLLSADLSYLRGFLAGYIATDGCITEKGILILNSSRAEDLEFCRQAFFKLGVSTSSIQSQFRKGYSKDGSLVHKMTINTKNLDASFFLRSDQRERFMSFHKKYTRNRYRVTGVIFTGILSTVYCAEVPIYHCFALEDNLLTGNCFSCGAKGSAIRLLTRELGVNYFDAVELVNLSGILESKKAKSEFDLDIVWKMQPPTYFLSRGYKPSTLRHFKLGETLDGWMIIPFYWEDSLKGYQRRKQIPDRIVQNNPGFNKKEYLYNYDTSFDYVIVVEGYSDVMRLYEHGYNATAVLGADLSSWQVEKISKFPTVFLAFDNDEAGRRATEIAYRLISPHTDVRLIPYTTKDPGECRRRGVWKRCFEAATDYAEYSTYMAMYIDGYIEMRDKVWRELKRRNDAI